MKGLHAADADPHGAIVLGENYTNPGLMMASTLVSVVPVLVIFMFANKYVVKGFTQSGIK